MAVAAAEGIAKIGMVDLVNRDPNDLNAHVKVAFDDVIAEPDGAHSIDCCWRGSAWCFNCCKSCAYNILTIIYGIPLAIFWGCEFAVISFYYVWIITPCMRVYLINCQCLQKFWGSCLQCCIQPCCEAYSFIFSNIKISKSSD